MLLFQINHIFFIQYVLVHADNRGPRYFLLELFVAFYSGITYWKRKRKHSVARMLLYVDNPLITVLVPGKNEESISSSWFAPYVNRRIGILRLLSSMTVLMMIHRLSAGMRRKMGISINIIV